MKHNIPYGHHSIAAADIASVINILKNKPLTQGPAVEVFEKSIAHFCGSRYAVSFSNGTTALHGAYAAAGFQSGDEIIIPANTFVATSNMALFLGAVPVFCDITPDTHCIDTKKIPELITPKTRAIVPVHFAGHPADMNEIFAIAQKYNLIVIEDAAHALGARYRKKHVGALASDMTMFSFHPVKSITTAEGGVITTNNAVYEKKLKLFRSHGVIKNELGINEMISLGHNFRLPDILCALGSSQMKRLDGFLRKRRAITRVYQDLLSQNKHINLPTEKEQVESSWHLYVITLNDHQLRHQLYDFLKKHGIFANFHYPPVYSHPYYQKIGYMGVRCENAENYFSRCLSLPIFPDLSKKEVAYICSTINGFFKNTL